MIRYFAAVTWTRGVDAFLDQQYSRGHRWTFDEGVTVPASASPHVVPAPWTVAAAVDPEEALVAAVSSCHMLFFLSFASSAGFTVESYEDAAEGVLEKNREGRDAMTRFTLRPSVSFKERAPSVEECDAMHQLAHAKCYVANSLKSEVVVESVVRLS